LLHVNWFDSHLGHEYCLSSFFQQIFKRPFVSICGQIVNRSVTCRVKKCSLKIFKIFNKCYNFKIMNSYLTESPIPDLLFELMETESCLIFAFPPPIMECLIKFCIPVLVTILKCIKANFHNGGFFHEERFPRNGEMRFFLIRFPKIHFPK